MEKKKTKYKLARFSAFIMGIMVIIVIFFKDIGLNMYEKIFWSVPLVSVNLLIIDDIISELNVKNKIFIKIGNFIFFINWILISSISIISLYLDFSLITKLSSLLCIFSLGFVAYRKYVGKKNNEEIERKE